QISALSAFLLFQALHPAALPTVFRIHEIASQISSPPPQASSQAAHASSGNSQFVDPGRTFIQPSSIPPHAYPGAAVSPSAMEALDSICHGTCGASLGVSGGTGDGSMPILQQAKNPVVISHLDEGQIISRVQPVYPVMAKAT